MKLTLFERLLNYYGINEEEYSLLIQDKNLEEILSYKNFDNIIEASKLVLDYVKNNKKILIYGDYDADGVMATSILSKTLSYLNYKANYYIPNRYIDSYGINVTNAEKIIKAGYDLVITVDNGVSAFEAISLLKENGVKVIILDHHLIQEDVPNADYIIHPSYSNYGKTPTSAGFVTYMFSIALLNRCDKYLATLAAISLVSDMMPLVSYNRDLLKNVIKNYKKGEFKNLDLLLEDSLFDEDGIGVKIAPKINAIGRIIKDTTINRIVKYFISNDEKELLSYLNWINSINEERKNITKTAKEAIMDKISNYDENKASISLITDLEEGLIGLIANTVLSEKKLPTIIFTISGDDLIKGSARSLPGFDVMEVFSLAKDFAITYGGHALAGGILIKKEDFSKFEAIFEEYAKTHPGSDNFSDAFLIGINEINEENYELIKTFSPFGEGWKAPTFYLKNIKNSSLTYSRNLEHIITSIGFNSRIVAFYPDKNVINNNQYLDLYGRLKETTFANRKFLDFVVKTIKAN
jgi:single-stranded-DNA-specific exonuclease